MSEAPNARRALNTLIAITSVTIICLVGIFAVSEFSLDGETLKFIVALAIVAIAGLGGYEIREQFRTS